MRSDQLTLLPPDGPVRTSPWRDVVLAWQAHVRASGERSSASWVFSAPGGSSERMSLASCRAREARTWEPSSGSWGNSGMGGPTECWTLVTSEWPSDGVECSLSDVLVTQPVPPRYYFEPEGGEWHPASSREARAGVAGTLGGGSGERGWPQDVERMTFVPELAHTLRSEVAPMLGGGN